MAVARLRGSDPSHYVGLGYDIARLRGLPRGAAAILNWWPPGMHLYYAGLFTILGPAMPVGVVAGLMAALLWALLLTAFMDLLGRSLRWAVVAAMVALVLLADVMQGWILGLGLLWSEGLFAWLLLAVLYTSARGATAQSEPARLGWAAVVGAILGVSAYVRTVSELIGWLLLALLVAWGTLALVRVGLSRARRASGRASRHRELLALALCVVAFQAVTVPWRVYAAQNLRPGDYSWSVAPNGVWHDSWTPDRVFRARDGQQVWLLPGRPNTACKVDPVMCRKIAAYETRQPVPYSGFGRYSEAVYRGLTIRLRGLSRRIHARSRDVSPEGLVLEFGRDVDGAGAERHPRGGDPGRHLALGAPRAAPRAGPRHTPAPVPGAGNDGTLRVLALRVPLLRPAEAGGNRHAVRSGRASTRASPATRWADGSEPVLRQQQRHPWRSGFGHFGPNLARPSARLIQGGRSAVRPVKRAVAGVIILLGGLAVAALTSQLVNDADALSTVPPIEGMQAAAFRCLRSELAHEVPAGATILLIPPSGDNGVWIQRATEIAYPRNGVMNRRRHADYVVTITGERLPRCGGFTVRSEPGARVASR